MENLFEVYVDPPSRWISEHRTELARLLEFYGEEKVIGALDACLIAGKLNVFLSTLSFQVTRSNGIEKILLHCYFPGVAGNPDGSATVTIQLPDTLTAWLHAETKRQWLHRYLKPPVEWIYDLVETLLSYPEEIAERVEKTRRKAAGAPAPTDVKRTEIIRKTIEGLLASGLYELVLDQRDIAPGKSVRYVLRRKERF